jgi:hypothetical protein
MHDAVVRAWVSFVDTIRDDEIVGTLVGLASGGDERFEGVALLGLCDQPRDENADRTAGKAEHFTATGLQRWWAPGVRQVEVIVRG